MAVASPAPSPTFRSTSIPIATQVPGPTIDLDSCEALGAVITDDYKPTTAGTGFYRWRDGGVMGFRFSRVVDRTNPGSEWTGDVGDKAVGEPNWLPGDTDLVTSITMHRYARERLPIEITSVSARLRLDSGGVRDVRIRATTNTYGEPRLVMHTQNIAASGILTISATWQDRCLAFEGSASGRVRIFPGDVVRACPDSANDTVPYIDRLLEPRPELGGVPLEVIHTTTVGWIWKRAAYSGHGDPFPAWARNSAGIFGPAGATFLFDEMDANLELREVYASSYRRGDVIGWLDGTGNQPRPVDRDRARVQSDHSFLIQIPSEPGRYVTMVTFTWKSPCLRGHSYGFMSIEAN